MGHLARMQTFLLCCATLRCVFVGGFRLVYRGATFRYALIFPVILRYFALCCAVFIWVVLGWVIKVLRCVMLRYFALFCALSHYVVLFSPTWF